MFAAELPTPMDVPNLITMAPNKAYRTYGRLVTPLLGIARARIRWAGLHVHALAGERRAEKFMIVSYPSHKRFMGMIANPYYLFANRWRERGVARFEASFTTPVVTRSGLRRAGTVLVMHFNSEDGPWDAPERPQLTRLDEHLESAGASLLYASVETSPMTFLTDLEPNDPNPLVYRETAVFAVESAVAATAAFDADLLAHVDAIVPGAVLQLYERLSVRELIS